MQSPTQRAVRQLERRVRGLPQAMHRLRIVDAVVLIHLSIEQPDADVAALWDRIREDMSVEDDGTGEQRIHVIARSFGIA